VPVVKGKITLFVQIAFHKLKFWGIVFANFAVALFQKTFPFVQIVNPHRQHVPELVHGHTTTRQSENQSIA
jgi:hypothetical protein